MPFEFNSPDFSIDRFYLYNKIPVLRTHIAFVLAIESTPEKVWQLFLIACFAKSICKF